MAESGLVLAEQSGELEEPQQAALGVDWSWAGTREGNRGCKCIGKGHR